jgi:hypothetical protein
MKLSGSPDERVNRSVIMPKIKTFKNDGEIKKWIRAMRIGYRIGLLKQSQIKRLEAIPGWLW